MRMMDRLLSKVDMAFTTLSRLLITMRMSALVMASYAILQGILIIVGGPDRFAALGYSAAMQLPGAPESWGVAILLAGVTAFWGVKTRTYRLGGLGMLLAALWSLMFAIAFCISATRYPEANLTAIAAYGKDAILFTLMASAYRDMWHQQQRVTENEEEG